ncbi:hypothetical protein OIO90_003956 [Microbotryomycetes sp. JL221]|nr:hypothetical protein OIO90_003956 [Microbotryomycetes sp. JL221]
MAPTTTTTSAATHERHLNDMDVSQQERRRRRLQRHAARAQVASPLSLCLFVIAAVLSVTVAKPNIGQINENNLTILTPLTSAVGMYWIVLFVLLVGHCVMLIVPGSSLDMLTNGVGLRLSFVNLLMAGWILCWTFEWFIAAQIILLVTFVVVLSMWATLFYYPATIHRPLDFLFTHVPIRMFLVILWQLDVWQGGLLALHYSRTLTDSKPHWEQQHSLHGWIVFGVIIAVSLLSSVVVFLQRDLVWAVAAIYVNVANAVQPEGKPPQIFIALVLSCCAIGIAYISAIGWQLIKSDQEGAIRLVDGEEQEEQA